MTIFKKSDDSTRPDKQSAPKTGQTRPLRSKNVAVIGSTLVIKGELSANEDLIIEGHIEGTIAHHKKHLTVGESGRVKADIHASSVIVLGQLVGDIHSEGIVSLAKTADVKGNIYCARLFVEDGARFKGNIDMANLPKINIPKESVQTGPAQKESVPTQKTRNVAGHTAKSSVF